MNNIKVNEKLYKKMELEYNDFILDLKKQSKEKILDSAYEKIFKEEMLSLLIPDNREYSEEEIQVLSKIKKPLDFLYREWLDLDISINDLLMESVDLILYEESRRMKSKNKESR